MKVVIVVDEMFPCYSAELPTVRARGLMVEVSTVTALRWRKAQRAFDAAQKEMAAAYEAAQSKGTK